jgi:hypothetical protein
VPIAVLEGLDRRRAPVFTDRPDDRRASQVPEGPGIAERAAATEAGRPPMGRLAGLAASGVFAFWASVTCFVC